MRTKESKNREFLFTETPHLQQPQEKDPPTHRSITFSRPPSSQVPPDSVQSSSKDLTSVRICLPNEMKETRGEVQQSLDCSAKYHKLQAPSSARAKQKKMSSFNMLFDRVKTETVEQVEKKEGNEEEGKSTKRVCRRRMCRLKTKQQFEEEYQSYLSRKEKENVDELFRSVNRAMKVNQRRNEGNVFYQNIRKDALNKIDYMHYNQKYYDDAEVRHLHSVVDSCNLLIHKKQSKVDAKPLYNLPPRPASRPRKQWRQALGCGGESGSSELFRKLDGIVKGCEQERGKMEQVRAGMKIFGFYCGRMNWGMQCKEAKLQNFLRWEELE